MTNTQQTLSLLENRITKIEKRNKKVELDKAWELSKTRSFFIALSTYVLIYIFMRLIHDNHPLLNAFVTSIGYLISNSTYSFLKKYWLMKKNLQK